MEPIVIYSIQFHFIPTESRPTVPYNSIVFLHILFFNFHSLLYWLCSISPLSTTLLKLRQVYSIAQGCNNLHWPSLVPTGPPLVHCSSSFVYFNPPFDCFSQISALRLLNSVAFTLHLDFWLSSLELKLSLRLLLPLFVLFVLSIWLIPTNNLVHHVMPFLSCTKLSPVAIVHVRPKAIFALSRAMPVVLIRRAFSSVTFTYR